jgi:NifU-like protein involved in Fe-S cluster formation
MKQLIAIIVLSLLVGCGVDSASTAATAAAVKKQEIEQGKKTMEQMQQDIGKAAEQAQQRTDKADEGVKY